MVDQQMKKKIYIVMLLKLPASKLKATPHIESRVKTLKKQTLAITDMLTNASGFGWDDENNMVICEKPIFDEWVKSHKDARGLWHKPFPLYDILVEVYGKDRANGENAESAGDAAANPFLGPSDNFNPDLSDTYVDENGFQDEDGVGIDFISDTHVESTFPEPSSGNANFI